MAMVKLDLKMAKLALKVSKTALTKAIGEFEWAGEQFERNKDAASRNINGHIRKCGHEGQKDDRC